MASEVDISNTALSHLGARAQVAAIAPPDGSVEAGYCARFYPIARRELIETHPWFFARTRVTLAEVTNTSTVWEYSYALPSDCMTPLIVLVTGATSERDSADFEVDGETLRTNESEAVLIYKRDITDTSKFPPTFTTGLGMLLASYLAGPIIKGMDGAKIGAQWRDAAESLAARGAALAANGASEDGEFTPGHMAVR